MNKLKIVVFTIALLSSMPVNADDASGVSNAAQTKGTVFPLYYAGISPLDEGGWVVSAYPGSEVASAIQAHKTFCEIATVVAAATLLKYSWQLGEKLGEVIGTFTSKKKCKKT